MGSDPAPAPEAPRPARLVAAARAVVARVRAVEAHREVLGDGVVDPLATAAAAVEARLDRPELVVAVVGEKKTGKSTLLNAVLGARLLGTAVREYTAALTFLRWGPTPDWEARFVDGSRERFVPPGDEGALVAAVAAAEAEVEAAERRLEAASPGEAPLGLGAARERVAALEAAAEAERSRRAAAESALVAVPPLPAFLERPGWLWAVLAWLLGWLWARRRDTRDQARAAVLVADASLADVSTRLTAARGCVTAAEAVDAARGALVEATRALTTFREVRRARFAADLAALTDLGGRGASVARLDVAWPSPLLPEGLVLVDTPGVNTHDDQRVRRAWEAVEEHADGCLLLSDLTQAASATTLAFARQIVARVPHLLLVLTRADRALEDAVVDSPADARAEVDAAVRGAVRRFAETIGQPTAAVATFVTAAEPALRELEAGAPGPAAEALGGQLARLFDTLKAERAQMQATRAAAISREALAGIDAAVRGAEAVYLARIEAITAQAIPRPDAWREAAVAEVAAHLAAALDQAADASRARLADALIAARREILAELAALHDVASLKEWSERLDVRLPDLVAAIAQAEEPALVREAALAVGEARMRALADLDARYRLVREAVSTALVAGGGTRAEAVPSPDLVVGAVLPRVVQSDLTPALTGLGAGALVGSLILPGVGTVVGAVVGALVGLLAGVEVQKEQVRTAVRAWFDRVAPALDGWVDLRVGALREAGEAAVGAALTEELGRFGAWIADRLREQEEALERARVALAGLEGEGRALAAARAELDALLGGEAAPVTASR